MWIIEAGYKIAYGPAYKYTLKDFQNEWYVGIICMLLTIVWILVYLRKPIDIKKYSLPALNRNNVQF